MQVRPLSNASIRGHLRQQRRSNTIGNHLNNRRKTGHLVRHDDILFPQLTGFKSMISKAVTLLE